MTEPPPEVEWLDLERAAVVPALQAALYWSGAAVDWRTSGGPALGWLRRCWAAGEEHLPCTLVHDLGHLLVEGRGFRLASGRDLGAWPESEHPRRLAYEERVLGRWLLDPTVDAAHLALVGVPQAQRSEAVAHAVTLALAGPLRRAARQVAGNAAWVRALADEVEAGLPARFTGWAATDLDAEWLAFGAAWHEAALAALAPGPLFGAADLWELTHFAALPSESQRLALRQLHGVRAGIGPAATGLAARVRRQARELPVQSAEADVFPAGGFDAISTRGRFENLARSEVAYVGAAVDGGVDAFDLRYALGELLYYTRDESPLLEAKRRLSVVVDAPAALREKDPALPAQSLVIVEGLYLRLHDDLLNIFGQNVVQSAVWWRLHDDADAAVAEEERGLLEASLEAEISHGRVTLETELAGLELPAPPLVVLSPLAAPGRRARGCTWVRVDGPRWTLQPPKGPPTLFTVASLPDLRPIADGILEAAFGPPG